MLSPWNSPGQDIGVGSLSLLQGIFPTQRSNPGLPHCRESLPAEPQGKPSGMEEAEIKLARALHDEGMTEFRKRQRWLRPGFSDICRGRGTAATLQKAAG